MASTTTSGGVVALLGKANTSAAAKELSYALPGLPTVKA